MPFYIGDWKKDPGVQALDLEGKGLWREILDDMWECEDRGKLLINGKPPTDEMCGKSYGISAKKFKKMKEKLIYLGVASIDKETGCLISRRMVRDEEIRLKRIECGKKGGNPALTKEDLVEDLVNQKANQNPDNENEIEIEVKGLTKSKETKPTIKIRKVWFQEDWKSYPRKDGDIAKAEKCYLKSVTTLKKRKLFQKKMQEYVDSVDDPIYLKHGETFFRNWENIEVSGFTSRGGENTPKQQASQGRGKWVDGILSAYRELKEVPKILKKYPKEDEKHVLKVLYDFQIIESLPK